MLTNRYLPQRYARISPRSGYAPIFDNVRQMCINRCALMRRAVSGIVLNVLPSKGANLTELREMGQGEVDGATLYWRPRGFLC